MRNAFVPTCLLVCAYLILAAIGSRPAAGDTPVGTTFTYQGRLTLGGEPVSEKVDLEFRLFAQEAFGDPLGVLLAEEFALNEDGRFTIDLDFGDLFTGDARWLEIVVNETTLAPRQPIMAVPHAVVAASAKSVPTTGVVGSYSGITGVGTLSSLNVIGNTGLGTVNPAAKLHIVGAENNGTNAGLRIVSGNQVMLLDGNEIDTTDAGGLHLNHNMPHDVSMANGGGRVGIGTQFPAARLDVRALAAASGDNTARFSAPEIGPNVSHVHWGTNGDWFIRSAKDAGKVILQDGGGNVGIGIASPSYRLHVIGGMYSGATTSSTYGGTFGGAGSFGSGRSLFVLGETHMLGNLGVGLTNPTARVDVLTSSSVGVRGTSSLNQGVGVHGHATTGGSAIGVYGTSASGWAGKFEGPAFVTGNFFVGGSKNFLIDNPADPENEYLVHSCVESDEMKNIYDGVVTLDAAGAAVVTMPDWFELVNADFRYQLTCIGGYAPVYIARELENGSFMIAGEGPRAPGMKVSWQVTGNRIDPAARRSNHRVIVPKSASEKGKFLHPADYGRPEADRIVRMANPSAMTTDDQSN